METDLSGTIDPRGVDMLGGSLKRERERIEEKRRERRKVDRDDDAGQSVHIDYSDPSDLVSSLVEMLIFPLDRMIPESERCFSDDEDPVSVVWRQESSSDPRSLACPVDPPPDGTFLDLC